LKKLRKILFATLLVAMISYVPGAVEDGGMVIAKLVPENVRLSNSLSSMNEFAAFEKIISSFLRRWELAGASIAVARDGKLVYAKGFGLADREHNIPVEPYNKFRIASVSKLVTAIAIMKLQEEGKLSVSDKVFGEGGILNDPYFSNPKDKRAGDITIAHLLSHEGGWTTRWGDQMFMPLAVSEAMGLKPPVDTKAIVRFALNKNLHFTPGSGRSYSNLGYAILGLVIEKVTGMSYGDFCRKEILAPLGIYDMTLARNLVSEKAPFEVSYYEPSDAEKKPSIYKYDEMVPASNGGNDIEALGAAGDWLATAPDLMKLLLAVDGFDTRKDFLSEESIRFMTDTNNGFAPVGWKTTIYDGTWWRTGTFPGTACMLKRQADGLAWVVLLNSSAWNGPEISSDINYIMSRALYQVKNWPEHDLFVQDVSVPLQAEININ
jgi:CubicO group peptidase (beta-lactamase class C family)